MSLHSDIVKPVLTFEQVTDDIRSLAGGKGGTLSQLYQRGYPVPLGLVVMPSAFRDDQLNDEAWIQVRAFLSNWRGGQQPVSFAVRSSALSEDSAQASFAGEFETLLDVQSDEEIRQAIQAVRRSRHAERVQAYSQAQGMVPAHDMAVVVQKLIPAEISGVLFTVDPVSGNQKYMIGNFMHGLGEKLVSGQANAQTFRLERPKGIYDGPPELRKYAHKLFNLAARLEQEVGGPQDIEWAIADGMVHLLQSRPVTTLQVFNALTGEWNDSLAGDYLWTNTNLGEAMFDVMTPLTWTWLRWALGSWQILQGCHPAGNIGGRAYFNVSVFATMYRLMGMNERKMLKNIEGTLNMRLPKGMQIPLIPLPRSNIISSLGNAFKYIWNQWRYLRDMSDYLAENPSWCRAMQQQIQAASSGAELVSLWQREIKDRSREADLRVLFTANHSSSYTMPLWHELVELLGPEQADALLSNLNAGPGSLDCLGPVVGVALVARGGLNRQTYLEQWGHRGAHEFELSIPRPVEDPTWLDEQIAQYRESPVDVHALLDRQRTENEAAWERLQEHHSRRAKKLRRRINEAGQRAREREAARSELARLCGVMRNFALRAGELTGLGNDVFFLTLEELLDVLNGEVIAAILYIPARRETYERYQALPPYPTIIRGHFDPFQWAADPNRRSDFYDPYISEVAIAAADNGSTLRGAPGAAGRVEGIVRCLNDPDQGADLQPGEILVTTQTNIGWTPLFPRAAAIITDIGAPLSHAAIVARELGIPAVVGCGDASQRLKTGDRVRVDGGWGTIEVIESG